MSKYLVRTLGVLISLLCLPVVMLGFIWNLIATHFDAGKDMERDFAEAVANSWI